MSQYTAVIGLEIHAELNTHSKMFCSCKNDPDEEKPNTNICPVCMGHPGTLPMPNMEAIAHVIKIGLAVGGEIADFTEWDRKNYFYPDIPKGYQISQYKHPLVSGGELAGVALERIHLEEDTAQSTHDAHEKSLVDFNRSGVPLMELVTKPVIRDAATAVTFAKELQLTLRYLGAGEANMEKGEMRVEANISVAKDDMVRAGKFGTKTEVKNLNSFKSVEHAIAYEIERQIELLESGESVVQETRGWDDQKGETFSQRSKESSHDYRYFPDPDIPKMKISEMPQLNLNALKEKLPELPWTRRERFAKEFGMTPKEVAVFVESSSLSEYFESIVATGGFKGDEKKVKLAVNYLLSDYIGLLKKENIAIATNNFIPAKNFAELINLIGTGLMSSRGAKDTLVLMTHDPDASPRDLAEKNGLLQKSDTGSLGPVIDKIISEHAKVVSEYKSGKTASLQFLIGQAMKATKGSANPEILKKLFIEKLS